VTKDDANWAGEGFTKRNEESAPVKPPKLKVVKPKPEKDDEEGWVWE
jgi:hypothetical protein